MRQLRFVKQDDDGNRVVLETTDGNEQFLLPVDAALRDAIRSDLPRLHQVPSVASEAVLGPREIQMRVRAGESPQDLAEDNAMTLERVLRFAAPVLAERVRIADEARRSKARRSTTEGQTVIFGEAVDARFSAHGINPFMVRWDARRSDDGQWIVSAHWLGGEAQRVAEWVFHLTARNVSPLDDTAADLLSDRPIHASANHDTEPVRPILVSAPPLAPGIVAFPPLPQAEVVIQDEVFDQDAIEDAPPDDYDTPPLPLRLAESPIGDEVAVRLSRAKAAPLIKNLGVAHRDDETEDEKAARAHIPSWDDILLGVRRKGD